MLSVGPPVMSVEARQAMALRAKLRRRRVKTRTLIDKSLSFPRGRARDRQYQSERDWLAAAYQAAPRSKPLPGLYAFWNANKTAFKQIRLSPLVTAAMVEGFMTR